MESLHNDLAFRPCYSHPNQEINMGCTNYFHDNVPPTLIGIFIVVPCTLFVKGYIEMSTILQMLSPLFVNIKCFLNCFTFLTL